MQNKTYNKLFLKAKYLCAELDEHNCLFEEYAADFFKEVSLLDNVSDSGMAGATERLVDGLDNIMDEPDAEGVQSRANMDPSIKSLYKKIMLKVHPDKIEFIEDAELKEKYSNYCSRAISAINDLRLYDLIDIAIELGIEIGAPSEGMILELEECCLRYEKLIKDIKSTYPWIWARGDDSEKNKIILAYMEKNA